MPHAGIIYQTSSSESDMSPSDRSPEESPVSKAYLRNLSPEIRAQLSVIWRLNTTRFQRVKSTIGLKKRIASLESGVQAVNAAIEQLQCIKEIAESSKKVESRLEDSAMMSWEELIALYTESMNTESRIAHLLNETTSVGYEEDALKDKEQLVRLNFARAIDQLDIHRQFMEKQNSQQLTEMRLKMEQKIIELENYNSGLKEENLCLIREKTELVKNVLEEKLQLENTNLQLEQHCEDLEKDYMSLIKKIKELENDHLVSVNNALLLDEIATLMEAQKNLRSSDENPNSPLQKLIDKLPNTMKLILFPKEKMTGDELGSVMGSFVATTAYIVTRANRDSKITAMSGFATLCSQVFGTMFNNVVKEIPTEDEEHNVIKTFTSVPWIILGGVLPILVGGFIPSWPIRAIVTGLVTFLVQLLFVVFLTKKYKISKVCGFWLVVIGTVGIALSAGVPELVKKLAKN